MNLDDVFNEIILLQNQIDIATARRNDLILAYERAKNDNLKKEIDKLKESDKLE